MRLNWSDDEDFTGQFALWSANCRRSLRGRAGQRELRELEAALLELPGKRLIHGLLRDDEDGVCAIGAYAKRKGLDLSKFDPEDETPDVGVKAGMPRLVAWEVVAQNDVHNDEWEYQTAEGPNPQPLHAYWAYSAGYQVRLPLTPERRYERVLAWVRSQLRAQ